MFKEWVITSPKISVRYDDKRLPYEKSWWFRTVRYPIITSFHNLFYKNGRKVIPKNIVDLLDPLALAVWIMDDGCLSQNKIDISTYSFKLDEIKLLQRALLKRYALKSNYYADRNKGFRMYFSKKETFKLISLISSFVIPNLAYKILMTP